MTASFAVPSFLEIGLPREDSGALYWHNPLLIDPVQIRQIRQPRGVPVTENCLLRRFVIPKGMIEAYEPARQIGGVGGGGGGAGSSSSWTTNTATTPFHRAIHPRDRASILSLPPEILQQVYKDITVQDMVSLALSSRHFLFFLYDAQRLGMIRHRCNKFLRLIPEGYTCDKSSIETWRLVRTIGPGGKTRSSDGKPELKYCSGCRKWMEWEYGRWMERIWEGGSERIGINVLLNPVQEGDDEVMMGGGWEERERKRQRDREREDRRALMRNAVEVWCETREPEGWLEGYMANQCPMCWEKDHEKRKKAVERARGRTLGPGAGDRRGYY